MKYIKMAVLTKPPIPRISELIAVDSLAKTYEKIGYTIERPWANNEPNISCVPSGEYELIDHISRTKNRWCGGRVLAIFNPNLGIGLEKGDAPRHHCYLHSLNVPEESQGCPGPGLKLHKTKYAVIDSRKACRIVFGYFDQGYQKLIIQ